MIIRYLAPALLLLLACESAERSDSEGSPARPQAAEGAPPATVTLADFRTIRWIEGTWRGTGGGIDAFYERYEFIDDSTLRRLSFSDSSLANVSDSTRIGLRGSRVLDPAGSPEWQVTAFDSTRWRFESIEHAGRAFTWRRMAPDIWTATLESQGAAGAGRERVYTLTRLSDRVPERSGP